MRSIIDPSKSYLLFLTYLPLGSFSFSGFGGRRRGCGATEQGGGGGGA